MMEGVLHDALASVHLVQEVVVIDENKKLDRKEIDDAPRDRWRPAATLIDTVTYLAPTLHTEKVTNHRDLRAAGRQAMLTVWGAECARQAPSYRLCRQAVTM